jgi:hypothetical protein
MKKYLLLIIGLLLFAIPCEAASKVYINPETVIVWTDATTGGDELLDCGGLAADAVRMGSFADLGAAPRSQWYGFELLIDGFDAPPVVGQDIDLYFPQSIATTNFDGNPTTDPTTTVEGTMTVAQLKNAGIPHGFAIVYSTTAGDELKITGVVRLISRYVAPTIHNNTEDALLSTSDAHKVTLWAIPPEIQ